MKRNNVAKKGLVVAISFSMLLGDMLVPNVTGFHTIAKAESALNIGISSNKTTKYVEATGINVAYHTEEEVRDFIKKSGATPDDPVTYKVKPSLKAPYNAGSLTDKTLNSAIKMLNQIRYIAGISYNVTLDDEAIAKTQAASLVNKVNDELTHYPAKPSNMEESLYELGAAGAGSSNIAYGFSTINSSLIHGYMNDGDSSNIDRVGHRRWILNPEMSATGFGYCYNYSAMYAFDTNNTNCKEYGVAWPAQTMPTDYFGADYPWSISMGYHVDIGSVEVKLVRLSDNKTWKFGSSKADGYFNVNNGGYGQKGCIIFRPNNIESYSDGDIFQVTISGLEEPVSYQVSFFDLVPVTSISVKNSAKRVTKGGREYLEATITPSNASNKNIKWTSSNNKVAKVYDYGVVEGISYGTATITATSLSSGVSASYKITVVPNPVQINQITVNNQGKITIYYDKDKTVSGYEILYATNEKFTKNKKTKTIKKASTTKATISLLSGSKKHYVKMRSYVIKDGKKIYGEYSGVWIITRS